MSDRGIATSSDYGRWRAALDGFGRGEAVNLSSLPHMEVLGPEVSVLLTEHILAAAQDRLSLWSRRFQIEFGRCVTWEQAERVLVQSRTGLRPVVAFSRCPAFLPPVAEAAQATVRTYIESSQRNMERQAQNPGRDRERLIQALRRAPLTAVLATPQTAAPAPAPGRRVILNIDLTSGTSN